MAQTVAQSLGGLINF